MRPLVPIDLLRSPVFALSVAASVCAFAAYMLVFLALPFHFEAALHRSAVQTGLLMTPWPLATAVVAPIAGRLSDRVAPAWLGTAGMTLLATGLIFLAVLPSQPSTLDIVWRIALGGLGFGLFQAPNNRVLLGSAPKQRAGAAGGMLAIARLLGMTTGATLTAAFLRALPSTATTASLTMGAALAGVAAVLSVLRQVPHD